MMVNLKLHDEISRKLSEIWYIPNFNKNLISLSKLDLNGYTWRANDGILKIIYGNKIFLQEKKCRGYYLLIESLVQDRVLDTNRSLVRGGAPGTSRLGMRWKMQEDDKQRRMIKFLLL